MVGISLAPTRHQGHGVLPRRVVAQMAAGTVLTRAAEQLSTQQIRWLRLMSNSVTVEDLASQMGYSRRAMSRTLRALYDEMGVTSRTEALITAQEWGLLDTPTA